MAPPWIIDNPQKLDLLIQTIGNEPIVAIDTETVGVDPTEESAVGKGRIFCWSLAYSEPALGRNLRGQHRAQGVFLPAWGPWGLHLLKELKPWLESESAQKVGHNLWGFDRHIFRNHGIDLAGIVDTLTLSRLNDPGGRHGLKLLMKELLGYEFSDYKELFKRRRRGGVKVEKLRYVNRKVSGQTIRTLLGGESTQVYAGFEQLSLDELTAQHLQTLVTYSVLDAVGCMELYSTLAARVEKRGLRKTYFEVWAPLCKVVSSIESRGWQVNKQKLVDTSKRLTSDITELQDLLDSNWGPINYASPKQVANLLYNKLNLHPPKFRGSGQATRKTRDGEEPTDEIAIKNLLRGPEDPLNYVLLLKRLTKELQLVTSVKEAIRHNGRIYASLAPRTQTGRLSCRNPNLQQIPKRDKYGMRSAFESPSQLVVADFSQLELYVMAHYAKELFKDSSLLEALAAEDVHTYIAGMCWPGQTITKRHRDAAKAVTYGVAYGKTAPGLGASILDDLGEPIGTNAALELLDRYNKALPAIPRLKDYFIEQARETGGARTLLNRWRALPEIHNSSMDYVRYGAERQAVNTPIQGTAADVVALAMISCDTIKGARMICQIHDELIFEAEDPGAVMPQVKDAMENAFPGMLLKVDVGSGPTWGSAKGAA